MLNRRHKSKDRQYKGH